MLLYHFLVISNHFSIISIDTLRISLDWLSAITHSAKIKIENKQVDRYLSLKWLCSIPISLTINEALASRLLDNAKRARVWYLAGNIRTTISECEYTKWMARKS